MLTLPRDLGFIRPVTFAVPVLLKLNSVEYRRELYRSVYLHLLLHLVY
jgi:hypothetical protein